MDTGRAVIDPFPTTPPMKVYDEETATEEELYEEFIRMELIDAGCRSYELPDLMEQLVAENLPYGKIEARIVELGWGETDAEMEEQIQNERVLQGTKIDQKITSFGE
jgi:hypothetical protein